MAVVKHIQKTLTPIILTEGMTGYETVRDIEEKLNDPEVFNIAITGPYGSGKSTVLKSLKTLYPDNHKYLTISLASLTGDNEEDLKEGKKLDSEEQQKVEYSLLQQLIYKEKPETLPNSRFRRIVGKSICKSVWFGLSIIALIMSFLVVFEPKWLRVESFCQFFDLGSTRNLVFDIVCSFYMLLFIFKTAAYAYRHSTINRVRALNVRDVKIELNQDSSVFNKHLEEIVYFFETTGYNVVIIEDLDRFRCPEIFQKLREINFLLRQSEVLKAQNRHVKFIYAIKDDLFKDAERTKFFDYIATVTPVVNPKNSCEKLTQELTERGYSLDKETLRDLSEFVDDMRMLKNVANEFQQYMERLSKSSTPNQEKLLAMIIYKNHHPDGFGQLHYKKGKVYEFISKKAEWTRIAIDKVITPRLEMWQKKREDVVSTQRFTLKQWRMIYMELYREHLTSPLTSIYVQNAYHNIKAFIDSPDLFESLISKRNISYRYYQFNRNQDATADIDFSELEKSVDDKIGYMRRKELAETSTTEIDNEIRKVREEEKRLRNFKLIKLLVQFPEIKESDEFKKIGLSPLMVHFLQRGYIDETYYDYLTVFDGTTMSLSDRDLLSRIKQNSPQVTYDEPIDDIKAFVDELPLFVFEYRSVLNYQIVDYLEEHPVYYKLSLKAFEAHFLSSSTPPLDFLATYYQRGSSGVAQLWQKYVKANMSWNHIQTYERKEYWDVLTEAWLKYCDNSDIDNEVRDWLNSHLGFCVERMNAIGIDHLKEIFDGCCFDDLSSVGPIGGTFQGEDVMSFANYILENGMFELSDNNIYVACLVSCNPFKELRRETLTLSDILHSNSTGFKDYVMENIDGVFSGYLCKSEGQEEVNGLLAIINEEHLDESQKTSYLLKQHKTKVTSIFDVNDPYKPLAIRGKVLAPSWHNVLGYYASDQKMISDDLQNFINDNAGELSRDKIADDVETMLLGALVYEPYLKIDAYKVLLPVLMPHAGDDDEAKLTAKTGAERARLLVANNYLPFDPETASVVCQYGPELYAEYLERNVSAYIYRYDEFEQNTKSLSLLLDKGSKLTSSQRWSLAKQVSASLVSTDTALANSLMNVMWAKKEELTWPVVEAVIKKASSVDVKMRFQERLIKKHKDDAFKVITILSCMLNPYAEIVNETKRPLVPKAFKDYLDMLSPLGLFTSYKEEKNGLRVYHSTK